MARKNPSPNEKENESKSTFALNLGQIRALGKKSPVLRIATPIVLIALVVLIVVSMHSYVRGVPASNQATAQALNFEGNNDLNPIITSGIPRYTDIHTPVPDRPSVDVYIYEVQEGDNIFSIAEEFGIHPKTILWSNYASLHDDPRNMAPGDQLNILPVDGVYYQYMDGESISEIATKLNTSVEAIVEWPGNNLTPYTNDPEYPHIPDGTWLIIPGGSRAIPDFSDPFRFPPTTLYIKALCIASTGETVGSGNFIWPTTETSLAGLDWNPPLHDGIDVGGEEGNPIYAVDSGIVVFAGWSDSDQGFLIVIDHGDGLQTAYAHLSSVGVICGQGVSQGSVIGALGNTGNSTGPHLHFEITQNGTKVNPWLYVSP